MLADDAIDALVMLRVDDCFDITLFTSAPRYADIDAAAFMLPPLSSFFFFATLSLNCFDADIADACLHDDAITMLIFRHCHFQLDDIFQRFAAMLVDFFDCHYDDAVFFFFTPMRFSAPRFFFAAFRRFFASFIFRCRLLFLRAAFVTPRRVDFMLPLLLRFDA